MAPENSFVVVEIADTSSAYPSSTSGGLHSFPIVVKRVICSGAFLLALCAATSTLTILMHTPPILLHCLSFLLIVSCIRVFTSPVVAALIFLIERWFVMKTSKALYFVFALKTNVHYFLCSSSILLSWILFDEPDMTPFVSNFVRSTLATFVFAIGMSMFKIVVLKGLNCRFHDKNFFHDMQDLILPEYVLQTLLGPSERSHDFSDRTSRARLKRIKGAFLNMLVLTSTKLHTICDALDNSSFADEHHVENVISMIFENLTDNEHRDLKDADLLRVMKREDVANVFQLFEGAPEEQSISEASLKNWMVKVFIARGHIVQLLNTTSKVINQLDKTVLVFQSFLVALLWCVLMKVETIIYLVHAASHMLVFGYYYKMICEGIMLAIVMHPFDTGDHCIIDNEQLVVKEMRLIDTDFSNDKNETVNYLNNVLLTKSIINLNRSSELTDSLEILFSGTTSAETIAALKLKTNELIGSEPENWHADNCFELKRTDDLVHIYSFQITYATKFKNFKEMKFRRSDLLIKLGKIFRDLDIQNVTIK